MIFYIMGKSASGKDAVCKRLLNDSILGLRKYVMYTTRPMRQGEREGAEYHFVDEEYLSRCRAGGMVAEERVYHTVEGDWYYFTVREDILLKPEPVLMSGTLESFISTGNYLKDEQKVFPIYIECEDGERLKRALKREMDGGEPHYAEMCRRFLSDEKDFSEERLREAGIRRRFVNDSLDRVVEEISSCIRSCMEEESGKSGESGRNEISGRGEKS